MKVKELIAELQKQDLEKDAIMFDGPSYYTPSKVYLTNMQPDLWGGQLDTRKFLSDYFNIDL